MCEQDKTPGNKRRQKPLRHWTRFGFFAGASTILFEKVIFEAITKHSHLSWSELLPHTLSDIIGCFLGEKISGLLPKNNTVQKYNEYIKYGINITSHTIYELLHDSIHEHEHGNPHIRLLSTLILIKVFTEQLYHNREHKTQIDKKQSKIPQTT